MENCDKKIGEFIVPTWADYYKTHYHLYMVDGRYILLDKPRIETSFCYGYGMYGRSDDEEEEIAENNADGVRNSERIFISRNLEHINNRIDYLNKCDYVWWRIRTFDTVNDIYEYSCDTYLDGFNTEPPTGFLDQQAKAELLETLEDVKTRFIKRLNTYLKRYGLSKVTSWTYLRD